MRHSFTAALIALFVAVSVSTAADGSVYELRTYTCEPGKLSALHERFHDHTMQIFEKHGMKNVGYWTPTAGEQAENTLIYIIQHKSRDAAKESWANFINDPDWKEVARQSREAHGKILAKAPESVYMVPTDYSPEIKAPPAGKLFELRTYTTADDKMKDLDARFRDHTDEIFRRHGLNAIGYWHPVETDNVMIYILAFDDSESARAGWKAFGSDPQWQAARDASEKNGKLLAERPGSVYMKLTDYSPVSE